MKVYFFPPKSVTNPYIDHVINGLEKNGVTVINKGAANKYKKLFSSFQAMVRHTDVYHFNWLENKASVDTKKNRIICGAILMWLRVIRLSGGKLVWTMHNRESHDCEGDKTFHYSFLRKLISQMDMIVVHAKDSTDILVNEYHFPAEKICYVPHGSYLEGAGAELPKADNHDGLVFLAFGRINRYKNIPMLIQVFREANMPDVRLRIFGKCDAGDPDLLLQIQKEIGDHQNITYEDRYVSDEEANAIFGHSDIVILPYDKQSMINSGAAVKAFSEAKPIIVSRFGAMKDIEDRSFVHCYDYTDDADHKEQLKKILLDVYRQWCGQKESLANEGEEAFRYAKEELSWDSICETIAAFYGKTIAGELHANES